VVEEHIAVADFSEGSSAALDPTAEAAGFPGTGFGIKKVEHLLEASAGHPHVVDGVRIVSTQDLGFKRHEAVELLLSQLPDFVPLLLRGSGYLCRR
jgi:hypothetical protein